MLAAITLLALAGSHQAAGRSSGIPPEDPWSPAHTSGLPGEVRTGLERLARACGGSVAARHLFSRYISSFCALRSYILGVPFK
jgi:hypothetical protein